MISMLFPGEAGGYKIEKEGERKARKRQSLSSLFQDLMDKRLRFPACSEEKLYNIGKLWYNVLKAAPKETFEDLRRISGYLMV